MRRRHRNSNLPFVFGVFAGLLCVMTVGYAVFSTNLNINVKGNIGKKGKTPIDLIKYVVDSGDGLYKDTYEENRYVYKGANPNNYITFNNETWRIISVENDGTLKIMKKDSIKNIKWDTSYSNNWARPATLNTYLNDKNDVTSYYNSLGSDAKALVQEHTWGIGTITYQNTDLAAQIQSENSKTWSGNIALMNVSDYLRANTNTEQCGNHNLNNSNYSICKTTNWIFSSVPSSGFLWTISPDDVATHRVNTVDYYGWIYNSLINNAEINENFSIAPVLYLNSDITLSGEGTEDKPYTIVS